MRALEGWFDKQVRRQDRAVYLEEALLGDSFAPYALYRLRFFFGRLSIDCVLHVIDFLFLAFMFTEGSLMVALLARAAASFGNAWWWGGLEEMRQAVRQMHREQKGHLIPRHVSEWLGTSVLLAVLVLGIVTVGVVMDVSRPAGSFTPLHLYLLATAFRLAASVVSRTYHSGVYAIRRIYRPFVTIVGINLFGFLAALALWPYLGPWSFPPTLVVAACLSTSLTFWYTARVYRFLGLERPWLDLTDALRRLRRRLLGWRFHLAGVAHATIKLDAVLVLAMFHWARPHTPEYQTFLVLYLSAPLIRGSCDWAQLFYFDLKRLELDLFTNFRRSFEKRVASLSVAVAAIFWLCTCVPASLVLQKNLDGLYLALAAFFLVRSRLAFTQVRAFAERNYGALLASGLALSSGTLLALSLADGGPERISFLVLFFLCVLFGLSRTRRSPDATGSSRIVPPQEWLHRLVAVRRPVRVHALEVGPAVGDWQALTLARAIVRRWKPHVHATLMSNRRIVWFDRQETESRFDREWLVVQGSGVIQSLRTTRLEEDGMRALRSAQSTRMLGRGLRDEWFERPRSFRLEELRTRFQRTVPNGVTCLIGESPSAALRELSARDRHQIFHDAFRYSKNIFQSQRGRFEVTSLCDRGSIRAIFASDRSETSRQRREWRSFINSANLHGGVQPLVEEVKDKSPMRIRRSLLWTTAVTLVLGALCLIPIQDRATGSFTLRLANQASLRAPAACFLKAVHFEEGEQVSSGDVVTHLEVPDLAGRLQRLRAEAASLDTILHGLKRQGEQERPSEWARIAGLRAEIAYLEQVEAKLQQRSPVSGVVTTPDLARSVGRYYMEGETICEIQDPTVVEAEIALLEKRVERVRSGQEIELKALALPFQTFRATVDRVAAAAVTGEVETTVTVYCRSDQYPPELKPGMTGYARILTGTRPLGAVFLDRFLSFVRTEFWW